MSTLNPFSLFLKKLQADLGFTSSKSFYEYLGTTGPLNFNYTYFMKIEGAKQIPSPAIAQRIASLLPKPYQDPLYLAYCASLFPEREDLFLSRQNGTAPTQNLNPAKDPKAFSKRTEVSKISKGNFLSLAQVDTITRTKHHYFFFALISQARRPLTHDELTAKISVHYIGSIFEEFLKAQIIFGNQSEGYRSVVDDLRFPVPDSEFIQNAYARMVPWDKELPSFFEFQPDLTKILFKRCTRKSAELIKAHSRLLIELVRAAEDSNQDLNQEVLFLEVYLSFGNIPG